MIDGQRLPGRKGHVYRFGEFQYPSVTTILHRVEGEPDGLKRWRDNYRPSALFKSAREYTRYTSIRGTFIHYVVLNSLSPFQIDPGDLPKLDEWEHWQDILISDIARAKKLWDQIDIEVLQPANIEVPRCHHGLWYAGQPDADAMVKYEEEKSYTLIDIKTSKAPRDNHYIQLGAYAPMIHKKVERGLLIYLNPESNKPQVIPFDIDEIQENTSLFNSRRDEFYEIPGIVDEYGLVLPKQH